VRVRIAYTVDVDDNSRRAINHHYNQPGLATREQVRDWFRDKGEDNGSIVLTEELITMEDES